MRGGLLPQFENELFHGALRGTVPGMNRVIVPKDRKTNPKGISVPRTGELLAPRIGEDTLEAAASAISDLPQADNAPGAVERMLRANGILRNLPWPAPFHRTSHRLH